MKLRGRWTREGYTGDPLDVPADGVRFGEPIPLPWVVAWSRNGMDPIEAAWHESHLPNNMVTILAGCGRWNTRMTKLLGGEPDEFPDRRPWHVAEVLAEREVKSIEKNIQDRQQQFWKPGSGTSDFSGILSRVQLESSVAARLLANKIHRAISPPSIKEIMACIRQKTNDL